MTTTLLAATFFAALSVFQALFILRLVSRLNREQRTFRSFRNHHADSIFLSRRAFVFKGRNSDTLG